MKKMLISVVFVLMFCSVASAEWQDDFREVYTRNGIEPAVQNALEKGVGPDLIVGQAHGLADLDLQELVKALYCSGVKGQDVRAAAANNEIPESTVVAGYKESMVVCRDAVMQGRGYPATREFPGGRRARAAGGGKIFGSPSTFQ
ncbi:MAG: hypothetical protein JRC87_01170 [Deltaproteobacteria bacterium]|nr:hypothetical protein [Deltaproteobacteria bacterium]MBW2658201.1 hypothetical protein [Deltaproteobacteria bacterium]